MKSLVIIYNYNLPEATQAIFDKLCKDGFEKEQIWVVDNGSDKEPCASCTNFMLPKNVRFTGQARVAASYLLDFFDYQAVTFITTSARLIDSLNYFQLINRLSSEVVGRNYGFICSSLTGGRTEDSAPKQEQRILEKELTPVFDYQPIATVINRKLLELCRLSNSSYFNLELKRGWGIDRELQFIANKHDLKCYISREFYVEWATNQTHRKGVADESVSTYRTEAETEMVTEFTKKYGLDWKAVFCKEFARVNNVENSVYRTSLSEKMYPLLVKLRLFKIFKNFLNSRW